MEGLQIGAQLDISHYLLELQFKSCISNSLWQFHITHIPEKILERNHVS